MLPLLLALLRIEAIIKDNTPLFNGKKQR